MQEERKYDETLMTNLFCASGSNRRMETYFWIALAVVAFTRFMKRPDLSPALARELLSKGALLVDVRSPSEFSSGHIEGARNIPVNAIAGRSGELGGKDRPRSRAT